MTRMMRIAGLALVIAAIVGGILSGTRNAEASGAGQWFEFADGCSYLWDGYNYVQGACPRTDGGYDIYSPSNGQWVYWYSVGWTVDGGIWMIVQGQTYYFDAYGNLISDVYFTTTVGGTDSGWSYDASLYPTTATVGGSTYEILTGNPVVDAMILAGNAASGSIWLQPDCIEVTSTYCYVD
jgi:hypothetical protein